MVSSNVDISFVFAYGCKPLEWQYRQAKQLNISIIHRDKPIDVYEECSNPVINWLVGVLTKVPHNTLDCLIDEIKTGFRIIVSALCNLESKFYGENKLLGENSGCSKSSFSQESNDSRLESVKKWYSASSMRLTEFFNIMEVRKCEWKL